jgi:UrcA family protein
MVSFKSILIAAVGAASIGFAAAAGAQSSEPAPKLVVHYSPASLSTDGGVRKLYSRLVMAAEKVCEEPQLNRFPTDAEIACRKQAMSNAVAQIHNSRLADLSAGYYPKIG